MDLLPHSNTADQNLKGISSTPTIQLEPYGGTDWATQLPNLDPADHLRPLPQTVGVSCDIVSAGTYLCWFY